MFRDRGNIKWVSLMLPEHVRLLKEYKQDLQAIEKPIVDEQKYEEFNMIISQAIEENIYLEFTYYQKGQLKQIVGQVHHVNQLNKELHIISHSSNSYQISLKNIVEIKSLEDEYENRTCNIHQYHIMIIEKI